MRFLGKSITNFYKSSTRGLGLLSITYGTSTLAYEYYIKKLNRNSFEYYNLEFSALKRPPTELIEFIYRHLLIPFKFNLENSRIMSLHADSLPGSLRKGISDQPAVFIDQSTNSIDIYLPHFYEKDISVGHFLENSGKYYFFDGQPVDTLMHETTDKRVILDEFICHKMPSNEEMLARICIQMAGKEKLGIAGSLGIGSIVGGATLVGGSFLRLGSPAFFASFIVGMGLAFVQNMAIKRYDENLLWKFERETVASLSKEYTKGLFEVYEKERRINLLAYKLAGHQVAKKYVDSNGNKKDSIVPETEKLAFLRNRLIEQGGQVPEIKDSLDDEDEFYF
jgi:hypothetical protein